MAYRDEQGVYGGYNAEGVDVGNITDEDLANQSGPGEAYKKKLRDAAAAKAKYAAQEYGASNIDPGAADPGLDPMESFVFAGQSQKMPDWYGAEGRRVGGLQSPEMYGVQGDIDKQMDWASVARERAAGRGLQSSMAYDAAKRAAQSGAESYAKSGGYGSSLSRRAANEMSMAGQGMSGERAQAEQLERDQWAKQYAQWMGDAQSSSYADAELRNKWAIEREKLMGDMKGRGLLEGQRGYLGGLGVLQARQMGAKDALNLQNQAAERDAAMTGKFVEGGAALATSAANFLSGRSSYTEPAQTKESAPDGGRQMDGDGTMYGDYDYLGG